MQVQQTSQKQEQLLKETEIQPLTKDYHESIKSLQQDSKSKNATILTTPEKSREDEPRRKGLSPQTKSFQSMPKGSSQRHDSSDSSINSRKNQPHQQPIVQPKLQKKFRSQWQSLNNKQNVATKICKKEQDLQSFQQNQAISLKPRERLPLWAPKVYNQQASNGECNVGIGYYKSSGSLERNYPQRDLQFFQARANLRSCLNQSLEKSCKLKFETCDPQVGLLHPQFSRIMASSGDVKGEAPIRQIQSSYGIRPIVNRYNQNSSNYLPRVHSKQQQNRPTANQIRCKSMSSYLKGSSDQHLIKQLEAFEQQPYNRNHDNHEPNLPYNHHSNSQCVSHQGNQQEFQQDVQESALMSKNLITETVESQNLQSITNRDMNNYTSSQLQNVIQKPFQVKMLDSMIQSEQSEQNGFTLMNRGDGLQKNGLISSSNVRQYLSGKVVTEKTGTLPGTQVINSMLQDRSLNGQTQWNLMLEYFSANPDALMDALPTPKGKDVQSEKHLQEVQTNLSVMANPKKPMPPRFESIEHGFDSSNLLGRYQPLDQNLIDQMRKPVFMTHKAPNNINYGRTHSRQKGRRTMIKQMILRADSSKNGADSFDNSQHRQKVGELLSHSSKQFNMNQEDEEEVDIRKFGMPEQLKQVQNQIQMPIDKDQQLNTHYESHKSATSIQQAQISSQNQITSNDKNQEKQNQADPESKAKQNVNLTTEPSLKNDKSLESGVQAKVQQVHQDDSINSSDRQEVKSPTNKPIDKQ